MPIRKAITIDDKKYALGKSISDCVVITIVKLYRFGSVADTAEAVELLKPLTENLTAEAQDAWAYYERVYGENNED